MSNLLKRIRDDLASSGRSEFVAQEKQPALKKLQDQIQELRVEMMAAKKKAADEAAAPYLKTIEDLEKRYVFLLKLTA